MPRRTPLGTVAHVINTSMAAVGLTISKLPERNSPERRLRDLLREYQIDCVLDVGAHHGETGLLLRSVGYTGRLVSFEPSAANFALLSRVSASDQLWSVHRLCLGERDGLAELHTYEASALNSLHAPSSFGNTGFAKDAFCGAATETVPIRRLDSLLPELGIDPAAARICLKIDAQGHDYQVIQGAAGFLSQVQVLQTEVAAARIYEEVPSMGEMLDYLIQQNFLPILFEPVPAPAGVPIVEWNTFFSRAVLAGRTEG